MAVDARSWAQSLQSALASDEATAVELRAASVAGDLARWTKALTALVACSLRNLGLEVAAKGHRSESLPVKREEYLALDVTAFPRTGCAWRFPVAACELENSPRDDLVSYALWKVLSVQCPLRVVFCYRSTRTDGARLVGLLADEVVTGMPLSDRVELRGDTLIFVGSRSNSSTFPYGFFQAWQLNRNLGRFESFGWLE